jgi:hypothetical protein
MALSFVEIQPSSNGQTVYDNLSLNFVTTSDVGVSLIKADGTVVVATTSQFTVATSPTTKVTLTDSGFFNQVTTADKIRILRTTAIDNATRLYSDGSLLKSSDLNTSFEQILFSQQELKELGVTDALQKNATSSAWDAKGLRIEGLAADPVDATDAVSFGFISASLATSGNVPSVPQTWNNQTTSGGLFTPGDTTSTTGTYDGSANTTTFSMSPVPTSAFEQTFIVEIDGVIQRPNTDYTVTVGSSIGTIVLSGVDATSSQVVCNNFGLSRQVFDFPTIGQATTASETPITLRGATDHTSDIFLVEQASGNDILSVKDGYTEIVGHSGPNFPLVVRNMVNGGTGLLRIGSHGQANVHVFGDPSETAADLEGAAYYTLNCNQTGSNGDIMVKLQRTALKDSNTPERGNMVEIRGNNGSTAQTVVTVNQNGKVRLFPTDDTINTAEDNTAMLWIQPYNAQVNDPCNYILCKSRDSKDRFAVAGTQAIFGGGGDTNYIVSIGTDGGDDNGSRVYGIRTTVDPDHDNISGNNIDQFYFQMKTSGTRAAGNRRGYLGLNTMGESNQDAAIKVMRAGGSNPTTGNFVVRYDGDVEIYNANRTRAATSVLRQDEIRNESAQYTNIAVGHVVKGTVSTGIDQNVVISELNTSGYLSTSVIRADANRQVRIVDSGTYLVEIGGTIQAGEGSGSFNGEAHLRLEEANGSGSFTLIADARDLAIPNGEGCATLLYKRIITTTQLKKYRFMTNVYTATATLNTAFISIQRLSN